MSSASRRRSVQTLSARLCAAYGARWTRPELLFERLVAPLRQRQLLAAQAQAPLQLGALRAQRVALRGGARRGASEHAAEARAATEDVAG